MTSNLKIFAGSATLVATQTRAKVVVLATDDDHAILVFEADEARKVAEGLLAVADEISPRKIH